MALHTNIHTACQSIFRGPPVSARLPEAGVREENRLVSSSSNCTSRQHDGGRGQGLRVSEERFQATIDDLRTDQSGAAKEYSRL